ncbi:MAG: acetylserotonin O-methyltransferase [Acidobacteriota bacterium]|nr:acetylserotonin O-methyltransferase [Acidobacteriota bacterium]
MSTTTQLTQTELPPPAILMQMGMGFIVSQAVSVAARLYIADHLQNGAKSIEELAGLTDTHAASLYRLMRALSSAGVFRKDADGRFSNSPVSEFLRSDHPESMRDALHMICDREHWQPHGNLMQSVKTGEIAFNYTFGMPVFPYFEQNPEAAEVFDNAMTSFSHSIANAVAATYDFSGVQKIADIGGGHGLLLAKVLQTNPEAKGILFDQPHVVSGANSLLENAGVAERVQTVSGDFFAEIPVEADIYLMKFILHDWNDEQCDQILQNLAKSAKPGSKVLLVETVVEENDNQPSASKVMDLNMLVMTGGKERTATEYAQLFEKAGFKLINVHPTPSPLQIVEAVRV